MFVALVIAAACGAGSPVSVPPLSAVTRADLIAVRGSIDAGELALARARWAALTGWTPRIGATAYGRADALFSARSARAAFGFYGQLLFCGPTSELDPQGWDSGALQLLEAALARAAAGDLTGARRRLEHAAIRDPASIESRYFLGLVDAARGDASAARREWKAAIDANGYAQPPDDWTLPRAQQAALQRYLSAR